MELQAALPRQRGRGEWGRGVARAESWFRCGGGLDRYGNATFTTFCTNDHLFYQHRLGTDIGKTLKNSRVFLSTSRAYGLGAEIANTIMQ